MGAARINAAGQVKIYLGKCFRLFTNEKQWKNFISALLIRRRFWQGGAFDARYER